MSFIDRATPIGDLDEFDLDYTAGVLNVIDIPEEYNSDRANFVRVQVLKGAYDSFASDLAIARFTVDGNDPSDTNGFVMGANDVWEFQVGEIRNGIKFCVNDADITAECKIVVQGYKAGV